MEQLPAVANMNFLHPIDADFRGLKNGSQETHPALI